VKSIITVLKQHHCRITRSRCAIIDALTHAPCDVEEIALKLKKQHTKIDTATIYRTLECLVSLQLIGKTQYEDAKSRYELLDGKNHHHHLVCEKCGKVKDIVLKENILMKQVSEQSDFQVKRHSLEFFGLCKGCQ
jgi:Fur family transcriptional regulator, ferric uptake regulator